MQTFTHEEKDDTPKAAALDSRFPELFPDVVSMERGADDGFMESIFYPTTSYGMLPEHLMRPNNPDWDADLDAGSAASMMATSISSNSIPWMPTNSPAMLPMCPSA